MRHNPTAKVAVKPRPTAKAFRLVMVSLLIVLEQLSLIILEAGDDPAQPVDTDEDGIPDHQEEDDGTDPNDPDSDDDGLDDGGEADNGTDPNDPDSDDDGLPDGWEVDNDLDPNDGTGDNGADGDPDGDGFTNQEEHDAGSDPNDRLWTPDGHFVPVAGPLTAAILALALGVLGYRKRR